MTPEPGSATPGQPQAHRTSTTTPDAVRARRWNRRERERTAKRLMSQAFIEIRAFAYTAKDKEDLADALERVRLLADACHNLPGVIGSAPSALVSGRPWPAAGSPSSAASRR